MIEFIAGVIVTLVFVLIYNKKVKNEKKQDIQATDLPMPPKPSKGTPY